LFLISLFGEISLAKKDTFMMVEKHCDHDAIDGNTNGMKRTIGMEMLWVGDDEDGNEGWL
jgi:hypothetical protein